MSHVHGNPGRFAVVLATIVALRIGSAHAADQVYPQETWDAATPAEVGMDAESLKRARDYALTGGGSGYVARHGKLVLSWGEPRKRYDLKSTTKSIGVTALGLAIADGRIELADRARKHHPTLGTPAEDNAKTAWLERITIHHLATQTAGFAKRGGYEKLVFEPGTKWLYSDGGPNWLAECVTLVYRRDLKDLMFERVFTPLGITQKDLTWRPNAYRPREIEGIPRREFGSGIHANVDAMARIGYLYLRRGEWRGRRIIPETFVDQARTTVRGVVGLPEHSQGYNKKMGNASDHYGLLWWNNADGTLEGVPRSTYWSWGLYDSLIVVFPELDIVVARAGKSWKRREGAKHYDVLRPFLEPILASVKDGAKGGEKAGGKTNRESASARFHSRAPHPRSPVITGITWAPKESIVRKARGSDNWPLAWADDGDLYTAYGDGRGFAPQVEKKLSMGFAKVSGAPEDFRGVNIRSESGETLGDGGRGRKASGLLMVDGVLYLWARNAGNSQLAWSTDHARTWKWSDWKLTTSFGYPTFLDFGRNYAGGRDDFVYVYSHDSDSAYEAADRMVLARVAKDRIRERSAYEFFVGLAPDGEQRWTREIERRGAVFEHRGRCYRSGISYNAGLGRYLWCQVHPGGKDSRGPRFQGGFGVYDAPEPWGPWTTVYFAEEWDVGPGETSSFPPKWMSADGTTLHLVFSGDDCFSLRRATLEVTEGFVPLFDGKTLNGWQGATGHWAAEKGSLAFIRKGAARSKKELRDLKLMSTKEYSDFILRFDIKLPRESNNGVAIRAPLEGDPAFVGMEIQVQDPQYYRKLKDYEVFGSVYGVVAAKTGHLKPNGQWNTEEIFCIGRRVKITLNGTVIVDVDLESIGEKTKDGADHPGLKRTKGHIGFCGHTGRVEYRNIRIRDLSGRSTK